MMMKEAGGTNACRGAAAILLLFFASLSNPSFQVTAGPTAKTDPPLPQFTDITQQAGVAYKLVSGDEATEYLIDVNG